MHPPILPSTHHGTKLIVLHFHEKVGHGGYRYTHFLLWQHYWAINGPTTLKRYIKQCFNFSCLRDCRGIGRQMMATLPQFRVTSGFCPFTCTNVDYFGPLEVVSWRKVVKRYGCLLHGHESCASGSCILINHKVVSVCILQILSKSRRSSKRTALRQRHELCWSSMGVTSGFPRSF